MSAWTHAGRRLVPVAIAALAACSSMGGPVASDREIQGAYESLPSHEEGGRRVSVMLLANHVAAVGSAGPGEPSRFAADSKWDRIGNQVVIHLAGPRSQRLVFEYEAGYLVAKDWDPLSWGKDGPGKLKKQ